MKVVLSGGRGFVGRAINNALTKQGHQVVLLDRNLAFGPQVEGSDAIINLAGEPIAGKRWTAKQKEKILSSRVETTRAIVQAIATLRNKPRVLINASAIGYYGTRDPSVATESSPKGEGFLAEVCVAWEDAAKEAEALGLRVVLLRLGIVLEKEGGAMAKMLPPFRLFIGGPLGSGRQAFPWVHRDDVVSAALYILKEEGISGPVNAVAPEQVTMREFCKVLGRAMHRPSGAAVPAFVLKTLMGEMVEMFLKGRPVAPKRLSEMGYKFRFPQLEGALSSILAK